MFPLVEPKRERSSAEKSIPKPEFGKEKNDGTFQERRTYARGETIPDVSVIGGEGMQVDAWFA